MRIRVTSEVIEQLRQEAVKSSFYASACENALKKALVDFWEHKLFVALGSWATKKNPVHCVLSFLDGPCDVLVLGVRPGYQWDIDLMVKQKTKSGRWGKSEINYDISWALNCLTVKPKEQ